MLSIRKLSLIVAPALVFAGIVYPTSLERAEASTCVGSLFASGDGSDADPYVINTAEQFRSIRSCDGTNNLVFSIRQNIDLGGEAAPLQPFGDSAPFTSEIRGEVFDGTNTVSARVEGIYVNGAEAGIINQANVGTTIKNLVVSGKVIGTSPNVGGLISYIEATSLGSVLIENVESSLTVEASGALDSHRYVGGLVGHYRSNTADATSLVVSASKVVYSGGTGKISANPTLPSNTNRDVRLGGILGYAGFNGTRSSVYFYETTTDTVIDAVSRVRIVFAGGLVGELFGVNGTFHRVGSSSLIQRSQEPSSTGQRNFIGGIVGDYTRGGTLGITESYFSGLIRSKGDGFAAPFISGFLSQAEDLNLSISNSYSVGTIIQEDELAGGLSGRYFRSTLASAAAVNVTLSGVLLATKFLVKSDSRRGAIFGSSTHVLDFSGSNVFYNTSAEAAGTDKTVGTNTNNVTGATPITSAQQANSATFANFSNAVWGFCPEPYLLWQGSEACSPVVTGARISGDGNTFEVFFSQPIGAIPNSGERFPAAGEVFSVRKNGVAMTLTGAIQPGTTSRAVFVPLPETITSMDSFEFSYTDPSPADEQQSQAIEAVTGGRDVASRDFILIANTSNISGPVALSLASSNLTPTSVDLSFGCGGSCDLSASYDYVASITPAGGSATTQTGTTTGTATLSFNNLTPNVAHAISVTVTQGGLTSPAATLSVTTPKPIATISALTVADISATLTVGCTNCGADPDSFVITATPEGGGAAITSTTNVVSGLTSETTYSFAVVASFAGVDSDSVNWQSNPVMTLPFVPIISSVSPAALPISGGTVTVTGSNFSTSNEVTVDGATVSFTIVNGTTITFTAPQKTAGDYAIAITNLVGTNTLPNAIRFVSGPFLSTNSPLVGTANGGTIVTLTGTDLGTASQVELGSATVSFSVLSETAIRFVTPAHTSALFDMSASAVMNIKVTTVGGTATLTNGFEYTTSALVPVVSAITPLSGPIAGGTTITVTGQYFSGSYSDSVSAAINGVSGSSIVLIDDSTLTFVSPAGAAATGLDVTIATGGGLGTLAGAFSYTAPPAPTAQGSAPSVAITTPMIVEFSTREIAASGAQVTATGQRLEGISVLTLGGMTLTIVSNTATSITFTTGEMPLGVWDLRLVGANGTLVFQNAIEVVGVTIVTQSTGELLGYTWTLRFLGNSRSLHSAQEVHLNRRMSANSQAETIICWGYTTSSSPNAWAIAHATQRAQAACDLALANNPAVKTVVRLRYGVEKNWAMRSAVQFWR